MNYECITIKGVDTWVYNDLDFERLIREHMGDDAGDLFSDIVGTTSHHALRKQLEEMGSAITDAVENLQRANEIIGDILYKLDD